MPFVTANNNGICSQSCVDQYWTYVDGIQCGGLSELQSCDSEICRNATRLQFFSCPAHQEPRQTLNQRPHPQTPPARIHHQTQLTRNRQRSPIRPRSTVQRNPARRPHRQCPRRRNLRTEPASTVFRCRLQPGLCRRVRAPGTEADTHRVPILNHCHYGRSPRYLGSRPPGKVARKQPHFIYEHGGIRLFNCFGESKRRPGVYFSPCQRPVPLRMHRSVAEVRNRRLFACQTVKLLRDLLRHVRPHSPGATRPAANEREIWSWIRIRLTCPKNTAGVIQSEQSAQV